MKAIMDIWKSAQTLRKYQCDQLWENYPYVFTEWKWYDYRRIKLELYNFLSSFIAHFLIKLKIKPNYITAIYTLLGILGGVLVAIPNKTAIYIAIAIFYFKGLLDWCDGAAARVNNQVTTSGAVFDAYAALTGWISLWVGIGLYLGHFTSGFFYYLAPIIPALFAADLCSCARDHFIYRRVLQNGSEKNKNVILSGQGPAKETRVRKIKNFIDFIFQHEVHSVDLIVLLILIEMWSGLRILWIYYSAFLTWQSIIFIMRLFLLTRGGWAERELEKMRKYIYG